MGDVTACEIGSTGGTIVGGSGAVRSTRKSLVAEVVELPAPSTARTRQRYWPSPSVIGTSKAAPFARVKVSSGDVKSPFSVSSTIWTRPAPASVPAVKESVGNGSLTHGSAAVHGAGVVILLRPLCTATVSADGAVGAVASGVTRGAPTNDCTDDRPDGLTATT